MLVRDPAKRYGIKQIKEHKWMKEPDSRESSDTHSCTDEVYNEDEKAFNEDVIQQMANLGISREKVVQVIIFILLGTIFMR